MSRVVKQLLIVVTACGLAGLPRAAAESELERAERQLAAEAEALRLAHAGLSFEEFRERVYREPFEHGKYIVNGDTALADEKHLREFYETNVRAAPLGEESGQLVPEFIVASVGGLNAVWSNTHKRALTYCVSDTFGDRHQRVAAEMESATRAWEEVADLDFIHVTAEDGRCDADNPRVVFDTRPVDAGGHYLARAFFPNEPRVQRNVLVDESSFTLNPGGNLQLVGILRHELGHTIGARHEHTRPDSGACFEDEDWVPLTDYDPFSVMHYPQCNGMGDWSLELTHRDRNGAACLYGPAEGFAIDPAICDGPATGAAGTLTEEDESVAAGEERRYGTQSVKPGTRFIAAIEGMGDAAGDPDLYLKFDGTPQVGLEYDCRPYLTGPSERCDLEVPPGASIARVMVHGYTAGRYRLSVSWREP